MQLTKEVEDLSALSLSSASLRAEQLSISMTAEVQF